MSDVTPAIGKVITQNGEFCDIYYVGKPTVHEREGIPILGQLAPLKLPPFKFYQVGVTKAFEGFQECTLELEGKRVRVIGWIDLKMVPYFYYDCCSDYEQAK